MSRPYLIRSRSGSARWSSFCWAFSLRAPAQRRRKRRSVPMRRGKTNTLLVQTPEGIAFSLSLAGPVTRFLAWAIDMAAIAALCTVLGSLFGLLGFISLD